MSEISDQEILYFLGTSMLDMSDGFLDYFYLLVEFHITIMDTCNQEIL